MTGTWPRCQDLTISGHDLSHPEVRGGRGALNQAEEGSDGLGFGGALWKVLVRDERESFKFDTYPIPSHNSKPFYKRRPTQLK